jgi:branched-chain amino acid transport system substrate-binding protein
MQCWTWPGLCAVALFVLGIAGGPRSAFADEILIGGSCDRTGPTKNVGTNICPGTLDYIKLVNKHGGVEGHTIRYEEVEHAYKVDRGVEAYERLKRDGAVAMLDYGTPIVYALTPRHLEDKILGITPGFGRADSTDGEAFPYIFPAAATYWSQMGAAMQFVKDQGVKKGDKLGYIFYDNPAGREPLGTFEHICEMEGYECRTFAVPPPGVEMSSQVLDITRRFRPDWVISHLFGKAPAISIKEFKKNGFPMDKVISLVWGGGEPDFVSAGWETSQGYLAMHFAGVGRDFQVIQEIMQMYNDAGEAVPEMVGGVYYNRGVLNAAILVEAVRQAIKHHGMPLTGEKVKDGMEKIKDFSLGGFLPPLTFVPEDHEGGGWVRIYQTKDEGMVPYTDWFRGYREVVLAQVKEAVEKEKNK